MAVILSLSLSVNCSRNSSSCIFSSPGNPVPLTFKHSNCVRIRTRRRYNRCPFYVLVYEIRPPFSQIVNQIEHDPEVEDEVNNVGVKAALTMLKFYKREISPLLPKSCRYVPTCSEYSMIAYKKYGVVKGTILTAWRLCRCNPLGGSGFDPPRWFDEKPAAEE